MKNNDKQALRKSFIGMAIIVIAIIIGATIQLNINSKTQTAQINENNETQENQNTIEETTITAYRRTEVASSRYSNSRVHNNTTLEEQAEEVPAEPEEQYISIDEIQISKNMDLTIRCGISKEDFKALLENTKVDTSKFFAENADTIYDLCKEYEINEVFFCGLIAGESGWNIASNHRNKHNYISMMSKGSLIYYPTVEDGLEAAAKLLHTKYLTPGGSFYSGKTLANIQKKFCPNSSTWVNLIYTCMNKIV